MFWQASSNKKISSSAFSKCEELVSERGGVAGAVLPYRKGMKAKIIILLTVFFFGKAFALLHDFSHNYFDKAKSDHCSICVISHANNHSLAPDLFKIESFAIAATIFFVIKIVFEKSFRPSSNLSRAPPQFS